MQLLNISKNAALLVQAACTGGDARQVAALTDFQLYLASIRFVLHGDSPLEQREWQRFLSDAKPGCIMPQIDADMLTIRGTERSGRMEEDALQGHICFCFLGLSAGLMCVCVLVPVSHNDKTASWSVDTVAVCLCNTCGFDNWVEEERQPLHDAERVCAGAEVQASTKDFLTFFSMHNKCGASATCHFGLKPFFSHEEKGVAFFPR